MLTIVLELIFWVFQKACRTRRYYSSFWPALTIKAIRLLCCQVFYCSIANLLLAFIA